MYNEPLIESIKISESAGSSIFEASSPKYLDENIFFKCLLKSEQCILKEPIKAFFKY